jgi:phosphatidylglycerophosphate synthase
MVLASIVAGTFFMFGVQVYTLIGALLFFLSILLDGVDGEIARARDTASLRGVYLDYLGHIVMYPYVLIGMSVGVYSTSQDLRALLFGFLAAIFWAILSQTRLAKWKILSQAGEDTKEVGVFRSMASLSGLRKTGLSKILRGLHGRIIDPTADDMMIIIFMLGAIFNQVYFVIIWFGVLLPLRWLLQVSMDLRHHFKRGF